jgi:hypothetical protein
MAWIVAMAAALGVGTPASAQVPTFGMIGLSRGQVAVLNLVLVDQPVPNHPGCRVAASFVDERGQVFVDVKGNPARRLFTLQPQIANALTLTADTLNDGKQRRRIRAVVTPASPVTAPSNCTCLIVNQEIINPEGLTALVDYGLVDTPAVVPMVQPRDSCNPPAP